MIIDISHLAKFREACTTPVEIEIIDCDETIHSVGKSFNDKYYVPNSNFEKEISKMKYCETIKLNNITLTYLAHEKTDFYFAVLVIHIINTMLIYFNELNADMNIYLFLTDSKREFDGDFDNIKKNVKGLVVGGCTKTDGTIILTKKEDLIHLTIHEMLHFLKQDRIYERDLPISFMTGVFDSYEVQAESMTIIFECAYYAYLESNSFDEMIQKYKKFIKIELEYSYVLSKKVIQIYDFFNIDNIEQPILLIEYVIYRTIYLPYLIQNINSRDLPNLNYVELRNKLNKMNYVDNHSLSYTANHLIVTKVDKFWEIIN